MIIAETFEQKLAKEMFSSWKDHLPTYVKRHSELNPGDNVIAVITHNDKSKEWVFTHNLVTNDGAQYYAETGTNGGSAVTVPFNNASGRLELGNLVQTIAVTDTYSALNGPIVASRQTWDVTFPKTNDVDTDNTGSGVRVITWKVTYTPASFNDAAIQGGVIHDAVGAPVGGSKLLTHFSIASFSKASTDTLKMIINHTPVGV